MYETIEWLKKHKEKKNSHAMTIKVEPKQASNKLVSVVPGLKLPASLAQLMGSKFSEGP